MEAAHMAQTRWSVRRFPATFRSGRWRPRSASLFGLWRIPRLLALTEIKVSVLICHTNSIFETASHLHIASGGAKVRMKFSGKQQTTLRLRAFTLVEVMVGVGILSIIFTSVCLGLSQGFSVVQVARENLRATEILQEK